MKKQVALRIVGAAVLLAGVVGALVTWRWRVSQRPGPLELVLSHSLGARDGEKLDRLLEGFRKAHPDVHVAVRFASDEEHRPAGAGEVLLRPLGDEAGMPVFAGDYVVLAYRRSLVPKPPTSWKEVGEISERLQQEGKVSYGVGIPEEPYAVMPLFSSAMWSGADVLATGKAGFSVLSNLRFDRGVTPFGCWSECVAKLLADKQSAFGVVGEWRLPELREALGDELAITSLPDLPEGIPVRSSRTIYGLVTAEGASVRERDGVAALATYLRVEAREPLFRSLGKVVWPPASAKPGAADVVAAAADELVRERAVTVSRAQLDSALNVLRPLWDEVGHGRLPVEAAAERLSGDVAAQARR